jgi:hypothetical protein
VYNKDNINRNIFDHVQNNVNAYFHEDLDVEVMDKADCSVDTVG